ncbi:hypothetical protein IKW75_00105 [Candidatus Saccharibacteria bacterium]|nr:hypothetical protein [Candidatus Saccharibacteria bacterium]
MRNLKDIRFFSGFGAGIVSGVLIGVFIASLIWANWTVSRSDDQTIDSREAAAEYLEQGVEIEGKDALDDIPTSEDTLVSDVEETDSSSDDEQVSTSAYHDDYYRDDEYHDIAYNEVGGMLVVSEDDMAYVRDKITTVDPNYKWDSVKSDLSLSAALPNFKHSFTYEELEELAEKELPLAEWNGSDDKKVTVYIPTYKVNNRWWNKFVGCGLLLVTTIEKDSYDHYSAEAELVMFSEDDVKAGHPLTFTISDSGYFQMTGPTLDNVSFGMISEERWSLQFDDPHSYTSSKNSGFLGAFGAGGSYPLEAGEVEFTNHRVYLSSRVANDIYDLAYEMRLGARKDASRHYSRDKSSFDMIGWLDPETGYVIDKELVKVNEDLYFIDGNMPTSYIITIQSNKIIVGVSGTMTLNLGEDRLYNGVYFEDTSKNPEMVSIKGTNLTLTRATLENLIYLLEDSGTNWWGIDANFLNLIK